MRSVGESFGIPSYNLLTATNFFWGNLCLLAVVIIIVLTLQCASTLTTDVSAVSTSIPAKSCYCHVQWGRDRSAASFASASKRALTAPTTRRMCLRCWRAETVEWQSRVRGVPNILLPMLWALIFFIIYSLCGICYLPNNISRITQYPFLKVGARWASAKWGRASTPLGTRPPCTYF